MKQDIWEKFDYSILPNHFHGKWVKEPRLGIMLSDGRTFSPQLALVDSGAYITLINDEVMDVFGISKTSCKKVGIGGIVGGLVEGFVSNIKVKVERLDEFMDMPVVFVPGLKYGNVLLGQIGFFENFKVKFEHTESKFYLSRTC